MLSNEKMSQSESDNKKISQSQQNKVVLEKDIVKTSMKNIFVSLEP